MAQGETDTVPDRRKGAFEPVFNQAVDVVNGSLGVNNYGGPSTEVGRSETDAGPVTAIRRVSTRSLHWRLHRALASCASASLPLWRLSLLRMPGR
jgi:hypothetical protein